MCNLLCWVSGINFSDPIIVGAIIQALIALFIGVLLILVYFKLATIEQRKVKLNLYEKRWAIYVKTIELLNRLRDIYDPANFSLISSPNYKDIDEVFEDYLRFQRESVFLFENDTTEFINEILSTTYMKVEADFKSVRDYVKEPLGIENLKSVINTEGYSLPEYYDLWANEKINEINSKFEKYLDFKNVK